MCSDITAPALYPPPLNQLYRRPLIYSPQPSSKADVINPGLGIKTLELARSCCWCDGQEPRNTAGGSRQGPKPFRLTGPVLITALQRQALAFSPFYR